MASIVEEYESEFRPFYDVAEAGKTAVWEFSQMFGEEDSDSDSGDESDDVGNWISSLSFDSTGKFLAVGYNCGQVVVLKQQPDEQTYQLYTEFKSHDSEFDFLTSMEIEEKINAIRWFPFPQRDTQRMLTTNDKTIKLFKMAERSSGRGDGRRTDVVVKPDLVFEGGHSYNINGIAFNSDGETFISSDDLRINLWNVGIKNEALSTVDIKPDNMDELTEVITCADLHPTHCNQLIYSSSKGIIRMGDLRSAALCEKQAKAFEDKNSEIAGFFQELVTTISDVKFSPCGRMMVSRDYLTMKIWDVRYEAGPVRIVKFHDHLLNKLCDLYENDAIFDKFEACWSNNSSQLLTGSYNNTFYICDAFGEKRTPLRALKPTEAAQAHGGPEPLACGKKILHAAWHPRVDLLALGAKDFGYLYQKRWVTRK
jgi:serine/threonine-protein phosphatase 2A regulatory subunit B